MHLEYPPRSNVVCNHCKQDVIRPYCGKKSKLSFFDVRLNGTPAQLFVYRRQEICPHCKKHIAVDLIPRIQVDSNYQMSIRLIHAITEYSNTNGISVFCKKRLAQGYGISYELLKKFFADAFVELREKANQTYSSHEKGKEQAAKFFYPCTTLGYTMYLCFSELKRTNKSPEFCLCSAIDKRQLDTIDSWAHGNFSPMLPAELTDRDLRILADQYANIFFPDINHAFAFRMVLLVIAYGKFMKSHRYATEDPGITDDLIACLQALSSGDMEYFKFQDRIQAIVGWAFYFRKQRIFRAARGVLVALDKFSLPSSSPPLRMVVQSSTQAPTKEQHDLAKRIVHLIERSLLSSWQWQSESEEDPEECYGTNSKLVILRLLYINPAVTYVHQDGTYIGTPLYGVPAAELEVLLKNGLLDDRGRPLADISSDAPMQ